MTEREKERRRRKERKKEGRRKCEEGGTEKGWNARSLIIGLLSLLSQLRTTVDDGINYTYMDYRKTLL